MARIWLIIPVLSAAACARDDGRWPSLAPRAAELRGLQSLREGGAPLPAAQVAAKVATGAVEPRLAAAERDLASARRGLGVERAAMASALAAAQGSTKDSGAWATAQLQLTRVDATVARLDELVPGIEAIAREAETGDAATRARAHGLAAGLTTDRATLSRLAQTARDALAR